ncbi:MAG: nucleotide exchange factor GrpE [Povalibacter sp.]|jgi:molecular chaperone GrpE
MSAEQTHPSENGSQPSPEVAAGANGTADLKAALEAAEARALEHKDLYMRALAELENVRKRSAREVEQAHRFAIDRFANDLIGVKDSLELGLNASGNVETLRAGTDATLKLLAKAFEKAGLTEVIPQGEMFNPELHEAMVSQPSADHVPNSVLQVVQKGYQLNGRLLRPARVIVAREP